MGPVLFFTFFYPNVFSFPRENGILREGAKAYGVFARLVFGVCLFLEALSQIKDI